MRDEPGWELCAPRPYSVVCFRPEGDDARSEALLEAVNAERRGLPLAHAPRRPARPAPRDRQRCDDRGRRARGLGRAQARGRAPRPGRGGERLMRVLVLQHIACEPPGVFEDVLRRARPRARARRARRGRAAARRRLGRDRRHGRADERERRGREPLAGRREGRDREPRARRAAVLGLVPGRAAAGRGARRARLRRARRPRSACSRSSSPRPAATTRCSERCRPASTRCSGTATRSTCPEGAVLLASSPAYPHQAFRVGPRRLRRAVPRRGDRGDGRGVGRRAGLRRVRRPRARPRRQRPPAGRVPRSARRSCSSTRAPSSSAGATSRRRHVTP